MATTSTRVSVHQGEMARNAEGLLKGQYTKFCLQPCTLAPAEWEQSGLKMRERLGQVALGGELNGQPPVSLCWVIPYTAGAIFLRQSTPLQVATAWWEAIDPTAGITLLYPVVLKQAAEYS